MDHAGDITVHVSDYGNNLIPARDHPFGLCNCSSERLWK
jgi:hypothetical protein